MLQWTRDMLKLDNTRYIVVLKYFHDKAVKLIAASFKMNNINM